MPQLGAGVSWGGGTIPTIGIRAIFDDSQAQQRMNQYKARVKDVESATRAFEQRSTQSAQSTARAQEASSRTQMRGLRSLRWELVTIMFFMRLFTRTVTAGWERVKEASEERALVRGVRALASVYGESSRDIAIGLQSVSESTTQTSQALKLAQGALLADQGRFSSEYIRLWESARVAAVTSGADAGKAFTGLVSALAEGEPALVDSITPIFRLEDALKRYAMQSGRTIDMLSEEEKQQVMLQSVYATTAQLLEAGAQEALDATAPIETLAKSWHSLTGAIATL